MTDAVQEIDKALNDAIAFESKTIGDNRLTEQYRHELINANWRAARAAAQAMAQHALERSAIAVQKAEASYSDLSAGYSQSIDQTRQATKHTEATVLAQTATDYSQVAQAAQQKPLESET